MSELKEIMLVNQVSGERTPSGTYKKAEADKVIEELIKEKKYIAEQMADVINGQEQAIRYHKYKRCLAMAQEWRNYAAFCGMQSHCHNHRGFGKTADKWTCKEIHAWKCVHRYKELAEKFKHNNEVKNA